MNDAPPGWVMVAVTAMPPSAVSARTAGLRERRFSLPRSCQTALRSTDISGGRGDIVCPRIGRRIGVARSGDRADNPAVRALNVCCPARLCRSPWQCRSGRLARATFTVYVMTSLPPRRVARSRSSAPCPWFRSAGPPVPAPVALTNAMLVSFVAAGLSTTRCTRSTIRCFSP